MDSFKSRTNWKTSPELFEAYLPHPRINVLDAEKIKIIGERLRGARETQSRSLESIAEATRISLSYLQAIESGSLPKLPETYIRAFIRSYAQQIDLNPNELLQENGGQASGTLQSGEAGILTARTDSRFGSPPQASMPRTAGKNKKAYVLLVLSAAVVAGLLFSVFLLRQGRRSPPAQEISFNDIVKEREAKAKQRELINDTAVIPAPLSGIVGAVDSLVLEGSARETVWVRVVIDGTRMKDYRLMPGQRFRVKAEKYFTLSLGNANAVTLSLNGESLDLQSPIKKPLWNVMLSRDTLKKRQAHDVKKEQRKNR